MLQELGKRKSLWAAFFSVVALAISVGFGVINAKASHESLAVAREARDAAIREQRLKQRSYWLGKVDHSKLVINLTTLSGACVHRQQVERLKAGLSSWGVPSRSLKWPEIPPKWPQMATFGVAEGPQDHFGSTLHSFWTSLYDHLE